MTAMSLMLLCSSIACGDDQAPEQAQELWKRIRHEQYRTWSRPAGYGERRASSQPHGAQIDVYCNDVAAGALAAGAKTWPDGSLFVKDGFDGAELDVVTAMEKRGGRWFFAEWDADGDSKYSGRPGVCLDCHGSGDAAVRAAPLPK